MDIFRGVYDTLKGEYREKKNSAYMLGNKIVEVAAHANYKGDWFGHFDYSITRLIQLVPRKLAELKVFDHETKYWIYASTVGGIMSAYYDILNLDIDDKWVQECVAGVLVDIKDEYKRRHNTAYEAFQILKSGDCYDNPYHKELIEVKDKDGNIGYQEIMRHFDEEEIHEE